eukprot:tig00001636_g9526.t1
MASSPSPRRGQASRGELSPVTKSDEKRILKQLLSKGRVETRAGPFGGEASLPQRAGYLPLPLWQRPVVPDISKLSIGLPEPPPETNEELMAEWSKRCPLLADLPLQQTRVQYDHVRSKVAIHSKRSDPSAFESRTGRAPVEEFKLCVAIFGAVQAGRRAAPGSPTKPAPVRFVELPSERIWSQDDVLKVVGAPLGFLKRDYAHVRTLVELRFRTAFGSQLTFEGLTEEGLFLVGLKFPLSPGPALHAWTLSGTMVKIDVPQGDSALAWFCRKRRVTTQELQEMQREAEEAQRRTTAHGGFFYAPVSYYLGAARSIRTEVQRLLLLEHGWRFSSWRGHVRTFWRRPELPGEPEIVRAHVAVRGADPDLVAALVWHLPSRLSWDRMLLGGAVIDETISPDVKVEHLRVVSPELDPAPRDLCLLWSRQRTRAGWIVACQSVQHEKCPRPQDGSIRSEVLRMGYGIATRAQTVDIFLVYQFDAKGDPGVEARTAEFFNSNQPRCLATLRAACGRASGSRCRRPAPERRRLLPVPAPERLAAPAPQRCRIPPRERVRLAARERRRFEAGERVRAAAGERGGGARAAGERGTGRRRAGRGCRPWRRPSGPLPEKHRLRSDDEDGEEGSSSESGLESSGADPEPGARPRRRLADAAGDAAAGAGWARSPALGTASSGDLFARARGADGEWRFELREDRPVARSWSDIFV